MMCIWAVSCLGLCVCIYCVCALYVLCIYDVCLGCVLSGTVCVYIYLWSVWALHV